MPRFRVRNEREIEQQIFANLRTLQEATLGASVSPVATARFKKIATRMECLHEYYRGNNISQIVASIHAKALEKGCLPNEINSLEPKSIRKLSISKILSIGFRAFSSGSATILHDYALKSDLDNETAELLKNEVKSKNLSLTVINKT